MNWGALAAAVLSAVALWTSAGLLTKRGRLRRRLDKDVAIADKLPAGTVRDHLQAVNTRLAAELIYHEHGRPRALVARAISIASVLGIVLAGIDLALQWGFADQGSGQPYTAVIGSLGGLLLGLNLARTGIYRIGVREYVNRVAEPVPPGLVGGESSITRGTGPTAPAGGRLRQTVERALTGSVHLRTSFKRR